MSPALVAFLRGLAEAVILAAIGVAITALSEVTAGDLAPWTPVALLALRQLEGVVDQIDETRKRAPERGAADLTLLVALAALIIAVLAITGIR